MPVDITIAQLLRDAITSRLLDVHVALPAVVESYDASKQTCEATPVVKRTVFDEAGEKIQEELPKITNIPVIWPRGGGFFATLPLEKGDHVILLFNEAAIGPWRDSGEISEAGDLRRHGLGYPVALPGIAPDSSPIADARNDAAVIGKDGSTAQVAITDTEIVIGKGAVEKLARADRVIASMKAAADAGALAAVPNDGGKVAMETFSTTLDSEDVGTDIVKGL